MDNTNKHQSAKTTITPDNWQADFFRTIVDSGRTEYAIHLFGIVSDFNDMPDPVQAISVIAKGFIDNPKIDLSEHANTLRDIMSLIAIINEIKSIYFCFDSETSFEHLIGDFVFNGKEVSHEN